MYLDNAKKRFDDLNNLKGDLIRSVPCSDKELGTLEEYVGLKLPESYKEFLRWAGNGGGCFEGDNYHFDYVIDGSNQYDALEMLQRNGYSEAALPKDAVVFMVYHGGYRFAFICTSEGDDPPVHVFQEADPQAQLVWNYSRNLEEHCLKTIEWRISSHTRQ